MKELGDNWTEPDRTEWTGTSQIVAEMYRLLQDACTRSWPTATLDQVALAMQATV